MRCRLLTFLAATGVVVSSAWAQTTTATKSDPGDAPFLARISGLFSGDLPQLDPPGTFNLILRPHFGDLVRRDYMRVDTGLRWALNDNFELNTEAGAFFTHGFGDSAGYGIGRLRFGSKYVFGWWPKFGYDTTIALNVELPVGRPPPDMTDGLYHFAPNFVVEHQSTRNHRLTTFEGMGLDLVGTSNVQGTYSTNEPHEDSVSFTAGGVYDQGQIKWTLTGTYATTSVISRTHDNFIYIQPGFLWYVPRKFTLHSKTQWIVGLIARTTWGPDGTDFSLGSRLRAEITFKQVMDKLRKRPSGGN